MTAVIAAAGMGVRFQFDRQRRPVTPALARIRRRCSSAWGLREIDLEVGPGEGVALVGSNGSGKTTLLRVLAGVFVPDAGTLEVRGSVGSLLSIEGGLMSSLTGRENALLLAVLAGLSRRDARGSLDEVHRLSGLGKAYERPVSTYSQGMRARLGFAVIEYAQPQVLLLDEVHEALDHDFREHVERIALALRRAGGVVVAAGHDHVVLERLCDRALRLDGGRIVADGPHVQVVDDYLRRDEQPAGARAQEPA